MTLQIKTRGKTTTTLILLFSSLLLENKTAEEAFHRLTTSECSAYHAKLTMILESQSNTKQINEARQADGQEQKGQQS